MELLRIANGELAFGEDKILNKADLSVQTGERICLVGRNGAGKSTLMKILMGLQNLDDGQILKSSTMQLAMLEQDPPESSDLSVFNYVAQGVSENADLLSRYHKLIHLIGEDPSEKNLNKLSKVQDELEQAGAWQDEQRIEQAMSTLSLNPDAKISDLSGGWLRKLALAKALVTNPDILLLDEPTNHLDIESVLWLEKFLKDFGGTIIFISHDRAFIRGLSTRILDLDRGKLTSYPGDYDLYIEQKQHDLQVEEQQNALFDKKLAEEEVWIRQGVKARRTRNEGRVRSLEKLRLERKARREVRNQSTMNITQGDRSGKLVFEAEDVTVAFGDKVIIENLNLLITRNDRLAFIGANGTGKSTLIKLIMEKLKATSGKMRSGVNLEIAYFDQHREALDVNKTVQEIVGEGKQEVEVNGKSRHVLGYLQDFLFSPKRARTPVRALSGGEKNRLLLARLFLRPSNLLILDEPTNDLDIETLELLEEVVANYAGTVILVSHDRDFVNNCVSSCLYFDGTGRINQIVGGYDDVDSYLALKEEERQRHLSTINKKEAKQKATPAVQKETPPAVKKKLSFKETKELEELPKIIDELENEITDLQEQVNQSDFFSQDEKHTKKILNQLSEKESKLDTAYSRWQALDEL
ncbi:ATP-binding cassette domain-containing protein [Colwellia sp. 4_MG-2023]|uniref:ATP-binding cassette ATPase Uup n=1 Tax=unclassified Colwellia TaxID=196834 RepID=UPI0026E178DA|nr:MULTISPECIES: ATP-binding cassette domain-containing protein [unclassified Colwellia]MDO6506629.1 ATP-binding cassette domain-containing protein [Colwellia sp. 5_MG-2023]MDO6555116.1 ATP-binding cassette domain-containing protein [Colwellia sp. 4_MG-2023]